MLASLIPIPVSFTQNSIIDLFSQSLAEIEILPLNVNLNAFDIKFKITCLILPLSESILISWRSASISTFSWSLFWAHWGSNISVTSSITSTTEKLEIVVKNVPASSLDRLRMSSMREYNNREELLPIFMNLCKLLMDVPINSVELFTTSSEIISYFDYILNTSIDKSERVCDGVEWSSELMRSTCKHYFLSFDTVISFFEFYEVGGVNKDMHESRFILPLNSHWLYIKNSFNLFIIILIFFYKKSIWSFERVTKDFNFILMNNFIKWNSLLMLL